MRLLIPILFAIVAFAFLIHDVFKSKNKLTDEQIQKNIMAGKIKKV
jgi:hypothetical protein